MSPVHPKPARAAPVPQGRARRFLHMGRAVGEMAAGAAAEGMARLARGENLALSQLMLTPGNARRLAERLSTMRGAVMKVGQLMSMDGKGVLPPAFAELLGGPARPRPPHAGHPAGRGAGARIRRRLAQSASAASASSRWPPPPSARCIAPRRTTAGAGAEDPVPRRAPEHRQRRGQPGAAGTHARSRAGRAGRGAAAGARARAAASRDRLPRRGLPRHRVPRAAGRRPGAARCRRWSRRTAPTTSWPPSSWPALPSTAWRRPASRRRGATTWRWRWRACRCANSSRCGWCRPTPISAITCSMPTPAAWRCSTSAPPKRSRPSAWNSCANSAAACVPATRRASALRRWRWVSSPSRTRRRRPRPCWT